MFQISGESKVETLELTLTTEWRFLFVTQLGLCVGIIGYKQELVGIDRRAKVLLDNMHCALWWQLDVEFIYG